ncbi:MAG TPA: 16S rRNA (uracil(1498)-N(3))-methyltransferase [Salinivirgaceae bacterium]|nr:16S rRNA (uracil(1498)-N(3))-methyltransferase [Salinivirgaceae bacterium]
MSDTFFYYPDIRENPQLSEEESRHCIKVLRMKEGDRLTITDGKGFLYDCILVEAHPKHCMVSIETENFRDKSWNFNLHIAFAPTKNMERNEWFVEKATEIGVDEITPLLCRFSERKEVKSERLRKIMVSAMKQSRQTVLPCLNETIPFYEFISMPFSGRKFIAHCYPLKKEPLTQTYKKGEDALLLIGPEGDFSEEEVQKAIEKGFQPISLGENRLRTETACLVACHTVHVLNQLEL